ncbi:prospero homeobox protein 1 [Salmo salar]|uniref:Prospero homeobox protein 1 n=1 Tax=Salmo salar TaxID=8030 RepID=A0A1S3SBB5_SALSA|nr:prospero homeobox protein 1 [Salmo salar]
MNPSLLDHSMHHFPSSTYPEDRAEHPPYFLHDNTYNSSTPPSSSRSSGGSLISMLLQKTIESEQILQESSAAYYHPDAHISFSALTSPRLVDHHSSTSSKSSSTTIEPLSPASQASTGASPNGAGSNQDWTLELGDRRQAKRARVENIIRGIAVSPPSPSVHCTDGETTPTSNLQSETMENKQENKRKQRVSQHQDLLTTGGASGKSTDEGHNLKKQLQTMQRLLGQLQARFIQIYEYQTESQEDVSDGTFSTGVMEDDHQSTWNKGYPETEVFMDPYSEFNNGGPLDRGHLGWKNHKLTDYIHSNPDKEDKLLADILKYELSRAVNSSVDSIFKNISHTLFKSPQLHIKDGGMVETDDETMFLSSHEPASSSTHVDSMSRLPPCSKSGMAQQLPEIQTEALSLVVQKPASMTRPCSLNLTVKRPLHFHQPSLLYNHPTDLQEDHQLLDNLKHNSFHHDTFGGLQCAPTTTGLPTPERVDLLWDPVKVKSKVTSRPPRSPQVHHPIATGHNVLLDSSCLPHVKMEYGSFQSMVKRTSYVLNEGLTTHHLKKAKLMFFYTRYPSSNVLTTFFSDVQLTRCIMSQLIKWFSNFREFYYIQMEKFARQARVEGVNSVRDVAVRRDSELFRALNMHYNKANDFQVPDRFLEVAEITLQEFYISISLARDSDPSWKKAIYKVISKLDSDVPAEFKAPPITT